MSESPRASGSSPTVAGVFVLGMHGSGVDKIGNALEALGLAAIGSEGDQLAEFNERLVEAIGGTPEQLPGVSPAQAQQMLAPLADEARQVFDDVVSAVEPQRASAMPWVWADPRLSILGAFWEHALALRVAAVLTHSDPLVVQPLAAELPIAEVEVGQQWERFNRGSLSQVVRWPCAVIRFDPLDVQGKAHVEQLVELLRSCGISSSDDGVERAREALDSVAFDEPPRLGTWSVSEPQQILARILDKLDGLHVSKGDWHGDTDLLNVVSSFYDEEYYQGSYDKSGVPYSRDEESWTMFFRATADGIVDAIHPTTALDVGCAIGMLVEALRRLGIDARGIDVSAWAIAQVPDALRPYCTVGSITDELIGHYDLITCVEVLEHLPPFLADEAVGNLCRHADIVLFSSTPDDFDEPTHLNVQPTGYWAQAFLRHGFLRADEIDATFLASHAVVFKRTRALDVEEIVDHYERTLERVETSLQARLVQAVAEHDQLAERYNALAREPGDRSRMVAQLQDDLVRLEQRRASEWLAAVHTMLGHERANGDLAALAAERSAELDAIYATKVIRYSRRLRRVYSWLRRSPSGGKVDAGLAAPGGGPGPSYDLWVSQYDTLDDADRAAITARLQGLVEQPLVSVLLPVYNAPESYLRAAVDSVRGQLYQHWELCIADDGSTEPHVAAILAQYSAADDRIKVITRPSNGHISAASNSALELATGAWVTPLDHDDVLREHALALAVLALAERPTAGLLYSDEDKIDDAGWRHSPNFKPDFDPLLLLAQNYLTHLCVMRLDLVQDVGGYREGYEGSQDWDLVLRVLERIEADQVVHVPHVLYHWRAHPGSTATALSAKQYAAGAGRRAVEDALARRGLAADTSEIALIGHNRIRWHLPQAPPLVTIIVPTKDGRFLTRCIDSLLSFTTYPHFEIFVVDNDSREYGILGYLRARQGQVTVLRHERPFNYSELNNEAVSRTHGEVICLLNDDTEIISGDWLDEMVSQLLQPGVGVVGAKLYYDDGRIQHAGVVLGVGGVAGHAHKLSDRLAPGYGARLLAAQHVSAVTGACMVVRRQAWEEVGGLDEAHLAVAFNDIDFCLRLQEKGWSVVWTPFAELYHHESITRGSDAVEARAAGFRREVEYMQVRWADALRNDPAYNPNLSLVSEDFALAWPPRVTYR